MKNLRIAFLLLCLSVTSGVVRAESGSAGGSIGNDEKSLSGSRQDTPDRPVRQEKPAIHHDGAPSNIVVRSHCPITGATGIGRGLTFESAKTAAIGACISKGGVPACCVKHADRI
jgi:hypothetical protein